MKYIKKIILLFAIFFTALQGYTSEVFVQPFEAKYSLRFKGNKVATMKRIFTQQGNGEYHYSSETSTTGLISLFRKDHVLEKSILRLEGKKLIPQTYSYDHSGGQKERHILINFDWQARQITNSINGSSWQMPIQSNIMDKLVYQLVIMQDLELGKKSIEYTIADGGKIKTYNFNLLGEEQIQTPMGIFAALKLERHRPDTKRKTTLWCARELGFLPIKVENIETNGKKTTTIIESLSAIIL